MKEMRKNLNYSALALLIVMLTALPAQAASQAEDLTHREDVRAFIERVSVANKLDADKLRSVLAAARVQQSILEAIARPAEKTMQWGRYRKIFLKPERIEGGLKFGAKYAADLKRAEQRFGVPASIIIAIIGVETRYGKHMGNYRVVDALATLAFDYPPRSKFFSSELEHFLVLSLGNQLDPLQAKGSYAGAMGYGQFMPSSYRAYAVDFDDDGLADIWNNPVDAIGSVANYFARHGWKKNGDVILPAQRNGEALDAKQLNASLKPSVKVKNLATAGLTSKQVVKSSTLVAPLKYVGDEGDEYWLGLHNFYVITRYNRSRLYAMAVYQLSQAIAEQMQES
ncbi:MAG: lytic murein transglycosylase B [Pseudomonadales bacterium]